MEFVVVGALVAFVVWALWAVGPSADPVPRAAPRPAVLDDPPDVRREQESDEAFADGYIIGRWHERHLAGDGGEAHRAWEDEDDDDDF